MSLRPLRRGRRQAPSLALAVSIALAAGCGGGDGDEPSRRAPEGAPGEVQAFDFGFRPTNITVKRGTSVTWRNVGAEIHNVKQLPGVTERFFSRALEAGDQYQHRFRRPGTFRYLCTLHPTQMRATVTVR